MGHINCLRRILMQVNILFYATPLTLHCVKPGVPDPHSTLTRQLDCRYPVDRKIQNLIDEKACMLDQEKKGISYGRAKDRQQCWKCSRLEVHIILHQKPTTMNICAYRVL